MKLVLQISLITFDSILLKKSEEFKMFLFFSVRVFSVINFNTLVLVR